MNKYYFNDFKYICKYILYYRNKSYIVNYVGNLSVGIPMHLFLQNMGS